MSFYCMLTNKYDDDDDDDDGGLLAMTLLLSNKKTAMKINRWTAK